MPMQLEKLALLAAQEESNRSTSLFHQNAHIYTAWRDAEIILSKLFRFCKLASQNSRELGCALICVVPTLVQSTWRAEGMPTVAFLVNCFTVAAGDRDRCVCVHVPARLKIGVHENELRVGV